jgi:hypothetical protein
METKWCHSCQIFRAKDGFKLVKVGSRTKPVSRWKCKFCLDRESRRKYESRK